MSVDSAGLQANRDSYAGAISADGKLVAFTSYASNLVPGDTNGINDVFVHDRATGLTERVSVDSAGLEANSYSWVGAISADGQIVAFWSYASNLAADDTNGTQDVFVHDRATGLTERISVDSAGAQGNDSSFGASISADGQWVAFDSYASNLVTSDTNGSTDAFVHDRTTGLTERVSVDSAGAEGNRVSYGGAISADGQAVVFQSYATNLVTGDTNGTQDVFVHDRATGITERVSVDSAGLEANGDSLWGAISADGQIVAYFSYATSLVTGDTNGTYDVFVHDRATGLTERVSVDPAGVEGDSHSFVGAISADGQLVAFTSYASNLTAGDTNWTIDAFVHDRATGLTERVSVDSAGAEGNSESTAALVSADGQVVAFSSYASNLAAGDTNDTYDAFVHERCPIDATWSNYGAGWPGTLGVPSLTASADPRFNVTMSLDIGNSLFHWNIGFLIAGLSEQSLPLKNSGTLLVDDLVLFLPLAIGPNGSSFPVQIPPDAAFCGMSFFLQVLELDPGASKGLSFTPGLELVFGH